jgi:hypothetical protein
MLHLVGWRSCKPILRIRLQISRIPHPPKIIKLVAGWGWDSSTVGSPARKARKLSEYKKAITILLPFLEMLADHPPAIVKDLGVIFVGA